MPVDVTLILTPKQASSETYVKDQAIRKLGYNAADVGNVLITRKSIDARRGKVRVNIGLRVYGKHEAVDSYFPKFEYKNVTSAPEVIVVGSGPAGLFAALRLLELGYKPIIIERGKDVSARKRDVAMLNRNKQFNPESNYAYGEGGAGTFSDGKLYTRSRKRGDINRILSALYNHGAQEEILYEAHPHIGTNVLPRVIASIRSTIEHYGGVIHFNSKVEDLIVENSVAKGVVLSGGEKIRALGVILATGHSARDIYQMLWRKSILVEAKPFAIGVRVEHPQELIDTIQYHGIKRESYLPAASYSLVDQVEGRGVYSFCMCPGGFIVPAVSGANEVVVNGMSPSARNSKWANSGIVVEVRIEDIPKDTGRDQLAGLDFQMYLEQLAFSNKVGDGFVAPAQRLDDFVASRASSSLPQSSYQPGLTASPVHSWLPEGISKRLQQGFRIFDRRMKGFVTNEAIVVALESRTSSPIRIPRDTQTLQHIQIMGLFPCGEGAGYAGGIVSSAVDGERCAEAFALWDGTR